VELFYILIL